MEPPSPFVQKKKKPLSSTSYSQTMSKRPIQQEKLGEDERVVATSKPMWNQVSKTVDWSPTALSSSDLTAQGYSEQRVQMWISLVWRDLQPEIRKRSQHRVISQVRQADVNPSSSTGKLVAETTKNPVGTGLSHHTLTISRNFVGQSLLERATNTWSSTRERYA